MVAALLIETKRLFKDRQFGAAFIAAPVFWAALWFYKSPQPDWSWPLVAPAQFVLLVVIYPVLDELLGPVHCVNITSVKVAHSFSSAALLR